MKVYVSLHGQYRMMERGIDVSSAKTIVRNPDTHSDAYDGKKIATKLLENGKKLSVIYSKNGNKITIVTAYYEN